MDRSTAPIQVVFDSADPGVLAQFWAAVLSPRGYDIPGPPGDFADWPAFLAANGVPEEHWNDASAIEADGQPRIFFQRCRNRRRARTACTSTSWPVAAPRCRPRPNGSGSPWRCGAWKVLGPRPWARRPVSVCTGASCRIPRATSSASERLPRSGGQISTSIPKPGRASSSCSVPPPGQSAGQSAVGAVLTTPSAL